MNSEPSNTVLHWQFPLPRTHCGIALGNGTLGLLIWGKETLRVTFSRAGAWDHRGGNPFHKRIQFPQLKELLQAGHEREVRTCFMPPYQAEGEPEYPFQINGGRIEFVFPEGLMPDRAQLDMNDGAVHIHLKSATGATAEVRLRLAWSIESAWLDLPEHLRGKVHVRLKPGWDWTSNHLSDLSYDPPQVWTSPNPDEPGGGFFQPIPLDPGLSIAWRDVSEAILFSTALADDSLPARARMLGINRPRLDEEARREWQNYTSRLPKVTLPDPWFQKIYHYAQVKLLGISHPQGIPASRQGPFVEEYQLPPWSNEYQFNIHTQLILSPAFSSNLLNHLDPFWKMLRSWFPQMREYGRTYYGVEDAMLLPYAVDDHCQNISSCWQGTVDPASTAWVAQLAWLNYRYSLDKDFLRAITWPLLTGAFNGFWALREEVTVDGQPRITLPISYSPPYGDGTYGNWGRDSSYHLAAFHALAQILPKAAMALGEKIDPRWAQITLQLNPYSIAEVPSTPTPGRQNTLPHQRIALWDGHDLQKSHRHHAHLAAIYPFHTIDPLAPANREFIEQTLRRWGSLGSGDWHSWSITWAAILCTRSGFGDAWLSWLTWMLTTCANEGDTIGVGTDLVCGNSYGGASDSRRGYPELMQMNSNMGFITALHEMFVHCHDDELRVLPAPPARWKEFSFDNILTEGGFLIGCTVENGHATEVRITSQHGGHLRLRHPLGPRWTLDGENRSGPRLETLTQPGQTLTLRLG